jgi:hypothetical protein
MTDDKHKIKIQLKEKERNLQCFNKKIIVDYQNDSYMVLTISTDLSGRQIEIPLVIDFVDYIKIKDITWYRVNHYIGHVDGQKKVNYIHQHIMNHVFDGQLYIDHINRIPLDNRKINLRLASQTQQNWNQKKRKRTLKLPDNCGFEPDEIPTNIEYHPVYESTGDYFEVSIKFNGERVFRKKTTKSKKFALAQKLKEAKIILRDLMVERPEWFENRCMNGHLSEEGNRLYESYFEILKLAQIEDPLNKYLPPEERNIDYLGIGDEKDASSKHVTKETKIDV